MTPATRSPRRLTARASTAALAACVIAELEPRRFLSGTSGGSIGLNADGTLLIQGTEKADSIRLSLARNDPTTLEVKLNRLTQTYKLTDITAGITIRSLGGSDVILVSEKNGALTIPLTVFAGAGNDKVTLGSGDDTVDAGDGNDVVRGGAGNDLLSGGQGNDNLSGDAGDDDLHGGQGNDKLSGNTGDDDLSGDDGNDNLAGDAGDDNLLGDAGNDRLAGQDGNDDLVGGKGDDYCDGGSGRDNIRGGRGKDTFASDDDPSRELKDESSDDDTAPTFDSIPDSVKSRFSNLFAGNASVLKLGTEDSAGDGVTDEYLFLASVDGRLHELKIAPDGTVLSHEAQDDNTPLTLADLPDAARTDFQTNYPGATLLKLDAEDGAGDGVVTEYELKFLFQGQLFEVKYAADGTQTSTESQNDGDLPPTVDQLPAAIATYLSTNYPDYTLRKVESEDGGFKVDFLFQGDRQQLRFNADGTLAPSDD